MLKKIPYYYALPAIIISIFLIAAIIYAWTEPSSNPPGGNVPAPINVGNSTQYKSGALGIGGILETETALKLVPANINESNLNEEGLIYYDNSSNKFRCYQGTAWVDCIGAGGGSGDSYWAANGSDIYNTNSGNVGIGTSSPTQKLDVTGYVRGSSGLCIQNDCRNQWPAIKVCFGATSNSNIPCSDPNFPMKLGQWHSKNFNYTWICGYENCGTNYTCASGDIHRAVWICGK